MVIDSNGDKKFRTNIVRHIVMDKDIGDNAAKFSFETDDGYVKLGICELKEPVGVGNKAKKEDMKEIEPHTVLAFDNVKSVDIYIKWLKVVKKALIKKAGESEI